MPDRYTYARSRVAAKLAEFSIGTVTLTRSAPGEPEDAQKPWIPGPPTETVYALDARVDGVSAEYVDGTLIVASDRVVITSPQARAADGAVVDIVPQMGDVIHVDGEPKAVKKVEAVPAAGPAARFHVFIAS